MDIKNAPDYAEYGISEDEALAVLSLSPIQLEYAYRVKQHEYRLEDAQNAVNELLENAKDDDDTEACIILSTVGEKELAEIVFYFDANHDCNADEVSQWENAVKSFLAAEQRRNKEAVEDHD